MAGLDALRAKELDGKAQGNVDFLLIRGPSLSLLDVLKANAMTPRLSLVENETPCICISPRSIHFDHRDSRILR